MPNTPSTPPSRARWFGLALLAVLVGVLPAARALNFGPDPEVQRDIESILDRAGWRNSSWGVLAVSVDRGDTLVAINAEEPLVPASNVKLLTTAAALHYLGPDFRYRTFVLADGTLQDGVLDGNVVLYGTGDPALSWRFSSSRTAVIETLADSLVALGVREVTGDIVGDGTYFEGEGRHPSWDPRDRDDWFAAPATALSFNENVVTLRVVAGDVDGSPVIHTIPSQAHVPVVNQARTVAGRPQVTMRMGRPEPESPLTVWGEIRRGGRDQWRLVTVTDPPAFAAGALASALRERGVEVTGVPRSARAGEASVVTGKTKVTAHTAPILATHWSPPLLDLLSVTNQESHNLYAELILKTLGRVVEGEGSFEAGARAVRDFLVEQAGVSDDEVALVDGSGLSRDNAVSAQAFVSALTYMTQTDLWEPLWTSLPEAGGGGRLRRMDRSPAASNLRAKTGTLTRVSALSGQLTTLEGERVVFSIIQNGVPSRGGAKALEDRLSVRLAAFRRAGEGAAVDLSPPVDVVADSTLRVVVDSVGGR